MRYNIEVSCTPDLIPTSLVLNLSGAEIGDSLHISAVSLPKGVTPTITDRDFTIATIAAPTVVKEETAGTDDGADTEAPDGDSTPEAAGDETKEGGDS